MIHSRKKGAHIGWMLLLLLVLSMGIASVQASAAPVSTAAKSADGKIVTKGSDKYYRYKDGSYAKNTWIKIGKRSLRFHLEERKNGGQTHAEALRKNLLF